MTAQLPEGFILDGQSSPQDLPEGFVLDGEDFSTREMISNIPSSAGKAASGLYSTVAHPIKTAKGIGSLAAGVVDKGAEALNKAVPENVAKTVAQVNNWLSDQGLPLAKLPVEDPQDIRFDDSHIAEKMGEAINKRYGGWDKFKTTLEGDPVGVLVDAAGVISGVGGIAKAAPGLGKAGAAMEKAGAAINPINIAANTAKYGAGKIIPKNLPKTMYEGVVKFGTTVPKDKRAAMVETALKNGLIPTSKGVAKLEKRVGALNNEIDKLISSATQSGQTIPAKAIYKHLKSLRANKGGMSLDATDDMTAINKVVAKFEHHLKKKGKSRLTPQELQELKVNTYKSINWDAKRMTGTPIKEDTYRAIAKGAKEGVEQMAPEVKGVNRDLSNLYELQPHLDRAAARIENKNIMSINDPLLLGAGAATGGAAGTTLASIVALLGKDRIKGVNAVRLQNLINDSNFQQFIKNNPTISNAELAAIIAGREL